VEPLITNRLDPALLRVVDRRSNDRDDTPRRRRPAPSEKPAESVDENTEPDTHELDDMA
jgi:hypothetical protein